MTNEMVRLELLGDVRVSRDGIMLTATLPRKGLALLAYLALTGRPQPRERLAALLWGETPDIAARSSLRKALTLLRQRLGPLFVATRTIVALDPALPLWCDATILEAALRHQHDEQMLADALALYSGDLLADLTLHDAEDFDDWTRSRRAGLRARTVAAFHHLAEQQLARDAGAAIATARQLLALEPRDKTAHQLLLRALVAQGDRATALAHYEGFQRLLNEGTGGEPTREMRALLGTIEERAMPATPRDRPPDTSYSLPAPLASFIGREAELARILTLLDGGTRALTIIGPGGIGKTHLALTAAWALRPRYAGGIWWVALAGLSASGPGEHERTTVASALASALGISLLGPGTALEALARALATRAALLVLDNAEHLVEVVTVARALLEAAPDLHILATSRAPIGIAGEALLRLDGLPVPSEKAPDWAAAPAMRLFLARAAQHAPGWDAYTSLAGTARLVRLLEGMPLALEMAAGWVGHYTTDEIADAIAADADFLAARTRDVPERHRSLRAVFDYTWELLTDEERRTLPRVSVFRGAFSRAMGQEVARTGALALISLTDKSLLRQAGEGRYSVHELLRQFAAERLEASGETATIRDQHALAFLRLAEEIAPKLIGPEQGVGRDRMEQDLDNLRAALEWTRQTGQIENHLRLLGGTGRFWVDRGYLAEGRAWLEEAIALPTVVTAPALVRARVFHAAGVLANSRGEQELAIQRLTESLELYRAAGEPRGAVQALATLGGVAFDLGRLREALTQYQACVTLAEAASDYGEVARALGNAGETLYHLGDLVAAGEHYARALALAREAGRRDVEAYVLGDLGNLAHRRGEVTEAEQFHRQALALKRIGGQQRQIAITLEDLARLAVTREQAPRAAQLLGTATALRARIGAPRPVPEQRAIERASARARASLGDMAWTRAYAEGQALPLDEVLGAILQQTDMASH